MMAQFPQLLMVTNFYKDYSKKKITLNTKCEYQLEARIHHGADILVKSSQIGGHREDRDLFYARLGNLKCL